MKRALMRGMLVLFVTTSLILLFAYDKPLAIAQATSFELPKIKKFHWSPVSNQLVYMQVNLSRPGPGVNPYDLFMFVPEMSQKYLLASGGDIGHVEFSTDGTRLSYWYDGLPMQASINSVASPVPRLIETRYAAVKGDFNSTGDALVYVTDNDEVYLKRVDGDDRFLIELDGVSMIPSLIPQWSPDGKRVAFVIGNEVVILQLKGDMVSSINRVSGFTSPDAETSSAVDYFQWTSDSSAIYDFTGKLLYSLKDEPSPLLGNANETGFEYSIDNGFQVYEKDFELYLRDTTSNRAIQLTNNTDQYNTQSAPTFEDLPATTQATADRFDYPLCKPDFNGCYVAGSFDSTHPGHDMNGSCGGDCDLNWPVYSAANGKVLYSAFAPGTSWGNIVLIEHILPNGSKVWSQYAHLNQRNVNVGNEVSRGQQIGTVGKGYNNQFAAHLHFEIRIKYIEAYAWNTGSGYLEYYTNPSTFINEHRQIGEPPQDCNNITYNGVILYKDKDCRGDARQYNGATSWINTSDFNDVTSSIYVKSGWSVRVYEHANNDQNGGKNRCITGSMWDLDKDYYPDSSTKINDTISSVQIFTNGSCTGGDPVPTKPIQLYKEANYGGDGYCYGENAGNYSNIDGCEGFNDAISSLLLKSGWSAWVFEHQKFGGGKKCYTGNDSDLSNDQFDNGQNVNDKISSFALYNSSNCPAWEVAPPKPSLSAPSNGATLVEGESINLIWNSSSGATGYYGEITGGPSPLSFGWQSGTSKNIGSQWPGYEYSWRVKASNSAGESPYSDTWKFKIVPKAPSAVSASDLSCNSVTISWNNNSNSIDGFRIYRDGSEIGYVSANITSYTDQGLQAETSYDYTVRAVRNGITSDAGNTASITTPPCTITWCDAPTDGIILYSEPNYTGGCITLTADAPYLGDVNFNDVASSIRFLGSYRNAGWQVSLFNWQNYAGDFANFRGDDSDLGNNKIRHDRTTSVRIWQDFDDNRLLDFGPLRGGTIAPYSDTDQYYFFGAKDMVIDLAMNGNGPDSYLVLLNTQWKVLAQDDDSGGDTNARIQYTLPYSGRYLVTARNYSGATGTGTYKIDLSLISSPPCAPGADGIVLYEHANYTGWCITLTGSDASLINNYFQDMASSIRFVGSYRNAGWQVSLFNWQSYKGDFANFRGDDANLGNNKIRHDRTTSVRIWQDFDDDRALNWSQPLNGTIQVPSDGDVYTFYGWAGQMISISMSRTDGSQLAPYLALYKPNWSYATADGNSDGDGNALINGYILPVNGIYKVAVRSKSYASIGNYRIELTSP